MLELSRDLFAESDLELKGCGTITMKIDTVPHNPIKLRPHKAMLTTRHTIDSIGGMLASDMIQRSCS